uniref:Uncharacterized protein n=1 Tax=Cacopsylla melanoneura TaxID=428564 RepID=A0A8D9BST8_9HEMI
MSFFSVSLQEQSSLLLVHNVPYLISVEVMMLNIGSSIGGGAPLADITLGNTSASIILSSSTLIFHSVDEPELLWDTRNRRVQRPEALMQVNLLIMKLSSNN